MVARTPPKQKKLMVAPHSLDPALIRQTLKKVDQCMARLQELQYTVSGGKKVVSGVNLSPRSTRAYLKTSLRCKQESIRMKSNNVGSKKSPVGKLPASATGEWRRMSLPAMLLGETVGEILQASKFAREITETVNNFPTINNNNNNTNNLCADADPKTPVTLHQKQRERHNPENPTLESRRKREKQHKFRVIHPESNNNITPPLSRRRARSRINFKVSPPKKTPLHGKENNRTTSSTILGARENHQSTTTSRSGRYSANRVSPKHRPWAKKTVLFPNPLFHSSSPTSQHHQKAFCNKTNSPVIGSKKNKQQQQTPHKFLIKSPPQRAIKSPPQRASSSSKFQVKIKSPPKISPLRQFAAADERGRLAERGRSPSSKVLSAASRLRRSLSPARLVNRFASSSKFQVKIKSPPKISPPRQFAAEVERGRLAERGRSPSKVLSTASRLRRSLSPARLVNWSASSSKFQVKIKSPPKISPPRQFAAEVERGRLAERGRSPSKVLSAASRLRRSLSPARLVNRLASPLKSRKTVQKTSVGDDAEFMAGLKRRNSFMSVRISAPRIVA